MYLTKTFFAIAAVLVTLATACGQKDITDPFKILNQHYKAIGGLDRVKEEKTRYVEGTIAIVDTGLEGTFKRWEQPPLKQRQEVDLKLLKQTSGDNGVFLWTIDANGKQKIDRDEKTLKKRKVQELLDNYENLNPKSTFFKLTLEASDTVGGVDCYVIKTRNTINEDVTTDYYDKKTFRALKSILEEPDQTTTTIPSDYRVVNGVERSFHQDQTIMPIGQKQTIQVTKYESNVNIAPDLFQPPAEDVVDFRLLNGGDSVVVPFQYIENHLYLTVNVRGKERLWILDSGAAMSVADSAFVAELKLNAQGNLTGKGAGNTVQVAFVTLPSFRLPGIEFEQQKMAVISMNKLFHPIMGLDVAGILGYDFLSRFVTRVDYAHKTLTFYLPDSFAYKGSGKVIDAPLKENFFVVPFSVDGRYSGSWNLDLGAGNVSFHFPYAEDHGLVKRPGIQRVGFGAGGSSMDVLSRFKTMEFAGWSIPDPIIGLPQQKGEGAFATKELVGNLGNDLFQHFTLYLDYKRQQVIVEKGVYFDRIFPYDRSGLQVKYDDNDRMEIFFVAPNTPAEEAGLQKGDILKSINNVGAESVDDIIAVRKLLKADPGTVYRLGIERKGSPLVVTLVLRDMI